MCNVLNFNDSYYIELAAQIENRESNLRGRTIVSSGTMYSQVGLSLSARWAAPEARYSPIGQRTSFHRSTVL